VVCLLVRDIGDALAKAIYLMLIEALMSELKVVCLMPMCLVRRELAVACLGGGLAVKSKSILEGIVAASVCLEEEALNIWVV